MDLFGLKLALLPTGRRWLMCLCFVLVEVSFIGLALIADSNEMDGKERLKLSLSPNRFISAFQHLPLECWDLNGGGIWKMMNLR